MAILFVGGGSRSGKSRHALTLARRYGPRRGFLATAQAFDDEMRDRIGRHQAERGGEFRTFEEPLHIGDIVRSAESKVDVLVVDCLTLWVSNILLTGTAVDTESTLQGMASSALPCIVVTNEVGCGIVPENALAREFRDRAGLVNQRAAALAIEAYWMAFGIPMRLK